MSRWSGEFSEEATAEFYNFQRCQRPDGTHYGTGGVCRKGAPVGPAEKAAMVKEALAMPFKEFEAKYGAARDATMNARAEEIAATINNTPIQKLSVDDARRAFTAKRLSGTLQDIDDLKALGPEGAKMAKSMSTTKEFFDDMKWRLLNDRVLVSEDTLTLAWEGKNLNGKANTTFGSKAFGQSKVAVAEHPVPSKTLKTELLSSKARTPQAVAEASLKRNFISMTSAREDNRLNTGGFKSGMPNPKVPMSRYQRSEVKTFMLDGNTTLKTTSNPSAISTKLNKTASEAKAAGQTKEEWIASIVELG